MSEQAIALNRFGLGARGDERVGSDPRGWLKAQLAGFDPAPPAIAALPPRAEIIASLGAYRELVAMLRDERKAPGAAAAAISGDAATAASARADDTLRQSRQDVRRHYVAGVGARLTAALTTETPFAERLVHFWSNHFAVSVDKLPVVALAADYEFTAIRPNLGKRFGDMAWAAIRHPAMLVYLDQAQSIGPGSPLAQIAASRGGRRQLGLNENLAREVMELHTLGVRTGYDQADVTEFARALTGWTVAGLAGGPFERRLEQLGAPGQSVFAPALHEPGTRTIMGKSYAEAGEAQARAVLGDLAASPATAQHIAVKLARHFSADDPPPALVARLAAAFTASGGDLPTLHRTLVDSPEVWTGAGKFKSPWEWTVSALRATGADRIAPPPDRAMGDDSRPGARAGAQGLFQQLGQPVWKPGSPAGWDDTDATWAGPGALMTRVEVAERMAGRIGDRIDARSRAAAVLPGAALSAESAQAIARADSPAQGLALLLVAPEFMRR